VVAARGRGRALGENEVVVAATADADTRPGEDELLAASPTGDRPQPQERHYFLRIVSLAAAFPVNVMMANSA
jgi:hypothetical protein